MMGASSAPGVDLDRIAASMSGSDVSKGDLGNNPGQHQAARQLGRSIAGAFSGITNNIKSKLVNIGTSSSPSPPDSRAKMREVPIRVEASDRSPHVIPLTVPGAEYGNTVLLPKFILSLSSCRLPKQDRGQTSGTKRDSELQQETRILITLN